MAEDGLAGEHMELEIGWPRVARGRDWPSGEMQGLTAVPGWRIRAGSSDGLGAAAEAGLW